MEDHKYHLANREVRKQDQTILNLIISESKLIWTIIQASTHWCQFSFYEQQRLRKEELQRQEEEEEEIRQFANAKKVM